MADPRMPLSGVLGPNGEQIYADELPPEPPSGVPAWYRQMQPYEFNLPALLQGLGGAAGGTGAQAGAIIGPTSEMLSRAANSGLGRFLMSPGALATGGAGAVLASPTEAGDPAAGAPAGQSVAPTQENLQRLLERQSVLSRQTEDARMRREIERKSGVGPRFQAADQEYRSLNDQLVAINGLVAEEQKRGSPEHALQMKVAAEQAEADRKAKEAATPFRERYPGIAGALPATGLAVAGAIPALLAAKRNIGSFFPGSPEGQVRAAIAANQAARAEGNAGRAAITEAELGEHLANRPTLAKELTKAGMAGAAGGALSAEAQMFPDQFDAFNLPKGQAQEDAYNRATSPMEYVKRGGMGALTGLSGYEVGYFGAPHKGANYSLAKALKDHPFTPTTPTPPSGPAPAGPAMTTPANFNNPPHWKAQPRGPTKGKPGTNAGSFKKDDDKD